MDENDDLDWSCFGYRCGGSCWNDVEREPLDQEIETIVCKLGFGANWFGSNWNRSDEDRNFFRKKICIDEI